jgi:putative membrane protein
MMMTGMMALMLLFVLFWVSLIAAVIALLLRLVGRWDSTQGRQDAALAMLRERFARGEIDAAEYQARRQVLQAERGQDADSTL